MRGRDRKVGWPVSFVAIIFFLTTFLPIAARAGTSWKGGDGLWSTDANWTNGAPMAGDAASIQTYNASVTFDGNYGTVTDWAGPLSLSIDFYSTLNIGTGGSLVLGSLSSPGDLKIGTGGWWSTATVNLYNGSLAVAGNTFVGYNATGIFNQSGGANMVVVTLDNNGAPMPGTGNLYLGGGSDPYGNYPFSGSGTGTYNLNTGTLTVGGNAYVGYNDASPSGSTFNQGAPVYDPSSLVWATPDGGTHTIGTFDTSNVLVPGTGNLYIGGGSDTTGFGTSATGTGTYNLYTGNLKVNGTTYVGYNGTGAFNQGQPVFGPYGEGPAMPDGGTHTTGNLYIGGSPDGAIGTGTYNLYAGNLKVGGNTYVGYNDASQQGSTFNQGKPMLDPGSQYFVSSKGGTHTTGNLYIGGGPDTTGSGSLGSGTGTYNLYAGTLTVNGTTYVGYNGTGTFNQGGSIFDPYSQVWSTPDGGTHTTGNLYIGGSPDGVAGTTGTGTYNLYAGNLKVNGTTYVGYNGTGAFNLTGGTITTGSLVVGNGGYLTAASGTTYEVVTNFENDSTQKGLWNTWGGNLYFSGAQATYTSNGSFGWGSLQLGDTTKLAFGGSGSLYLLNISGLSNGNFNNITVNPGFHVYYDPLTSGNGSSIGTSNGTIDPAFPLCVGPATSTTYTINGDYINFHAYVGSNGPGTLNQTDGSVALYDLYLGLGGSPYDYYNSGSGTYNLYKGSLAVQNAYVGYNDNSASGSVFNQGAPVYDTNHVLTNPDGASVTIGGDLYIGGSNFGTLGTGTYNLYQGSLTIAGTLNVGYNGSGTFVQKGGTVTVGSYNPLTLTLTGALYLGSSFNAGTTGAYVLSAGTLNTVTEIIGSGSPGTFTQYGGTHNVNFPTALAFDWGGMILGENNGAPGTYNLVSGTLTNTGALSVGWGGTAPSTFNQGYRPDTGEIRDGGTNHVYGNVAVGVSDRGTGYYNLVNGSLTVDQGLNIGWQGVGVFTQGYHPDGTMGTLGTSVTAQWLTVGAIGPTTWDPASQGLGTYNLISGSLTVASAVIGSNGDGTFNQGAFYDPAVPGSFNPVGDGGTVDIQSDLNVGGTYEVYSQYSLGTGAYNLYNGTLTVGGTTYVGQTGTGTFLQKGGSNTTNNLSIGGSGLLMATDTPIQGTGTYTLDATVPAGSSSNLHVQGDMVVGESGIGTFTHRNGVVQVDGNLILGSVAQLWSSANGGSIVNEFGNGTYNLTSGSLTVGNHAFVGYYGTGMFNQGASYDPASGKLAPAGDGGSVKVGGNLYVGGGPLLSGQSSPGWGTGTYTLYNGTLNVAGTTYVGYAGATGTFNQSGGTHTAGIINVGAAGTYNYSGGTITGAFQNSGTTTVTGGTSTTPNRFDASVVNNSGGNFIVGDTVNSAYITFMNAVTNNAGATFTINKSYATFQGPVVNNGTWITDPSGLTFDKSFTIGSGGSVTAKGDTYTILGTFTDSGTLIVEGSVTINLSSGTNNVGTLLIEPGGSLTLVGGSLSIASLVDPGASGNSPDNVTGSFTYQSFTKNATVPIPAAIWLLFPGLAALAGIRRRIGK